MAIETFVFTRRDVARLLPIDRCVTAVEAAFRALGRGEAEPPAALAVHSRAGGFHVKAGILQCGDRRYFASKTNGNFPGNPERFGLPTIQGLLILSDADDGRVLAVMDSAEITALRTGAATAVAARYLARSDAEVVTIVGCGVQGRVQLRALAEVLQIGRVFAYDVDFDRATTYAREMSDLTGVTVEAERDLATAAGRADICVTCTTGSGFVLDRRMIRAGTFVAGVGVDNETKRELAPNLLAAASKVVTDLRAQCAAIGDLHHAIAAREMSVSDVHADLSDIVAGRRPGREAEDEVIVFDSTGLAIQDVAAAAAIYENALLQVHAPGAGTVRVIFS